MFDARERLGDMDTWKCGQPKVYQLTEWLHALVLPSGRQRQVKHLFIHKTNGGRSAEELALLARVMSQSGRDAQNVKHVQPPLAATLAGHSSGPVQATFASLV